jgi:AraC-like DNA-binding protein
VALVLWFDLDWARRVTDGFVEFRRLDTLLSRARRGWQFSPHVSVTIRKPFVRLFDQPPLERLLAFLAILNALTHDEGGRPLASAAFRPHEQTAGRERIDRVLTYIHRHYTRDLSLPELADVAALSASGLHRMFRKHARTTVSAYITRIRIGDACARLASTEQPIAGIAHEIGYGTLANFNRQFRALTFMTPRTYRAHFRD